MAEKRVVKLKDLIINPTNARFVVPLEEDDERAAIEAICNDTINHIDLLLIDIAEKGLNANTQPLIMPSEVSPGKYLVMDGNRRLTSIKLMLQYNNELGKFNIPRKVINAVNSLKSVNALEEIECIYSEDETYINDMLEQLHTHKTGVSTVQWRTPAQERHNYIKGALSKVNALIRFLETSKYSNESIINNLVANGWIHKFKRFINNNKTIRFYFGFEFSKDLKKIYMYIDEKEIVKGLGQLLQDSINTPADGFAQKESDRNSYLDNFELQKIVDKSKVYDPVLAYHIEDGTISATTITPFPTQQGTAVKRNEQSFKEEVEKSDNNTEKPSNPTNQGSGNEENTNVKETPAGNSSYSVRRESKTGDHKKYTTDARPFLIPKNVPYSVTDQRSIDLLDELQSTYIRGHRNLIAMGFRSFIEFSVCVFIEKKSKGFNANGKNLLDKIRHAVDKLESIYGQKELKNIMPKVYQLLNTVVSSTSRHGDVAMFNLFVHSHKFHPQEDDLKVIYNNYEPFIKLLWDEINK